MANFMEDPVSSAAKTAYDPNTSTQMVASPESDMGDQSQIKTQLTQMPSADLAEIIVSLATPEQLKTIIGPALSTMSADMGAAGSGAGSSMPATAGAGIGTEGMY